MAAVPSPAAAVPVAAGPAPVAPAAAGTSGSSGGGGGGGRSSRSGRGDSGLAANAGADGGGYSAAGQQGGNSSGGGRMSAGGGGGYDSSGMDPQQQHMMRGMPPQQPPQQYMQLQQQGSGGPGGYAPVGSPVAGGAPGPDAYTGPNRTLYVGNLAASVDEQALQQQFGSYGPIANIQVRWVQSAHRLLPSLKASGAANCNAVRLAAGCTAAADVCAALCWVNNRTGLVQRHHTLQS